MGVESEDLSECVAWIDDLTLEDIIDRHKFLLATGKYATPDPKRPQIRMENPKLIRILDTKDEDFATNVRINPFFQKSQFSGRPCQCRRVGGVQGVAGQGDDQ